MVDFISAVGEVVDATPVVNVHSPDFDSQARYTPRKDSEKNSCHYIVDDRDYLTLEQLIARTKRDDPKLYRDIRRGLLVDKDFLTADEYIKRATGTDDDISRPDVYEVGGGVADAPNTGATNPPSDDPVSLETETTN